MRVHDVLADDLPDEAFDLVHLRLVLAWLDEPALALHRLIRALRPGGVLVAEEKDFVSVVPDPRLDDHRRSVFARVFAAHNAVLATRHAFDTGYGRRLAGAIADAGLMEVESEGRVQTWQGGGPGGLVYRLTLEQLRDAMVASGEATADDVDATIALCDDPDLACLSPVTVAAWGRRPEGWPIAA